MSALLARVRDACAVADLNSWIQRVRVNVESLMQGFEERFGYAPSDNLVIAGGDRNSAALQHQVGGRVPVAIVEFFDAVEAVSLPDVWNGYFLGPVDRVVSAYVDEGPRSITVEGELQAVLLIGSDGGGALYCASMEEPAPVFRLDQVSIRDGVATTPPGFTRRLAPDFPGFLEAFALAIESSAQGRGTPSF